MFNQTKTHLDGLYAKHTKTVNSKKKTHSEDLIRNLNNMVCIFPDRNIEDTLK